MQLPQDMVLILGGGNALGAYQGGAYQALHEAGRLPGWVVGASIGAINAALIAGNGLEDRIGRLRAFWRLAEQFGKPDPAAPPNQAAGSHLQRQAAALQTFMTGRPGLFVPRLSNLWSALPWMPGDSSLYDTAPLTRTLQELVDFERLNDGHIRMTATAVDARTGEDVVFDTTKGRIAAQHLRASAAFPIAYPPVEVDGRLLVDPGVSANLPLHAVFATKPKQDILCIAIDLFSPTGSAPHSIGDAVERAQDLVFANQARRMIEALRSEYEMHEAVRRLADRLPPEARKDPSLERWLSGEGRAGKVTLLHLTYANQGHEAAAKMFDYSARSVQDRWAAGYRDMKAALDQLTSVAATSKDASFAAFRFDGQALTRYGGKPKFGQRRIHLCWATSAWTSRRPAIMMVRSSIRTRSARRPPVARSA